MAKIVQISDFKGEYAITMDAFSGIHLQKFIDTFELKYLIDMLGVTLGSNLYADITTAFTPPTNTFYLYIFNSFSYDENNNQIKSEGIKKMLIGFIYFEYVRFQKSKNTATGNVNGNNEVSIPAMWGETGIYVNYNNSIDTYKTIQYHINQNLANYSNYNGLCKEYTSQFN